MILRGDLNFTFSPREVLGHRSKLDPLAPYLISLFEDVGLIDVEPMDLGPT